MTHIITAFSVVLPVFAIIGLGSFFRWRQWINDAFVHMAMKVIFNACLPSMLFLKVSRADISVLISRDSVRFAGFAAGGTLIIFFISRWFAKTFIMDEKSRGTFVQGSFRSNYVILGYAVLHNLFGDQIVGRMALLFVVIIPLYNILAIWVLSEKTSQSRLTGLKDIFLKILKNPLIISIVLGFIAAYYGFNIPEVMESTLSSLGSVGTPLGLMGIGAYMNFSELDTIRDSIKASLLKVLVFPLLIVSLGILLGFDYIDSAILFVLFGSPAAISSFIMATALGGNPKLAANIVIISTGGSLITFVIGLTLLGIVF